MSGDLRRLPCGDVLDQVPLDMSTRGQVHGRPCRLASAIGPLAQFAASNRWDTGGPADDSWALRN